MFLAVVDERVVGIAGGRWQDRAGGVAQLWGPWVAPPARGLGAGSDLVAAVREWAAAGGALFIRVRLVEPAAGATRRFYLERGFVVLDAPVRLALEPPRHVTYLARPI